MGNVSEGGRVKGKRDKEATEETGRLARGKSRGKGR